MIYQATINTPSLTLASDPKRTRLQVTYGLAYQFELYIPAGSAGLLHVTVLDGSYQVWPSIRNETFHGDNVLISFPDTYLKQEPPYFFDVFTYNLDDTYDHECQVRIGLVSAEVFMARFLPTYTYKYFKDMLVSLAEEQKAKLETQRQEIIKKPFPWLKKD